MIDITVVSNGPKEKFTIQVESFNELCIDEIWPDGDAPENPTAEDVARRIQEDCLNAGDLLQEWNLDATVSVG